VQKFTTKKLLFYTSSDRKKGFNIFPDLKSKPIKFKKIKIKICPLFCYFEQNKVCLHFLKHLFLKNYPINQAQTN